MSITMEEYGIDNEEWLHNELTGSKKKLATAVLNKTTISRYELDEIFATENN